MFNVVHFTVGVIVLFCIVKLVSFNVLHFAQCHHAKYRYAECYHAFLNYAECHYFESCYDECHGAS
jgi:hypothetical protein